MKKRAMILAGVLSALAVAGCGDADETEDAASASLVRTVEESAGDNCTHGGLAIQTGLDTDADGVLSEAEVLQTSYVCNGGDGDDGEDGEDGSAGAAALVETVEATNCDDGGTLVRVGLDTNGDGALQESEVTQQEAICNPPEVANAPLLIDKVDVPQGPVCGGGGTMVRVGRDLDGDGELADGEVESSLTECGPCPEGYAADPDDPNQCIVMTTIYFEGVIDTVNDPDSLDPVVKAGDQYWGIIEYPGLQAYQDTNPSTEAGLYTITGAPATFEVNLEGVWLTSKSQSELIFEINNDFGYSQQDEYRVTSTANEDFHHLGVLAISIALYDISGLALTSDSMQMPMDFAAANQHQLALILSDGIDDAPGPGPGGPVAGSTAVVDGTLSMVQVR